MKRQVSAMTVWLAIVTAGLGLVVLGYALAQQTMRLGANDPQRQLAEDTAARLVAGAKPAAAVTGVPAVEVAHSLGAFVVVTDKRRAVLASSSGLGAGMPLPPVGAFEQADALTDGHWFTWQPNANLREAAVMVPYPGGYVLAARSLREVEGDYGTLDRLALLAAAGVLVVPALVLWVLP